MESNRYLPLIFLLLSIAITITITIIPNAAATTGKPSAIYAFGDSVLDSGNNNNILTLCRANHKPYGADFPGRSHTGRFSNGKLPGDFLVSAFGIKDLLPAYADSTIDEDDLLTGVSFASSCSGLHDLTAAEVNVLNLDKQFANFEKVFVRMEEKVGLVKATATVERALFLLSAGASDMVDNYYLLPTTSAKYSLPAYHDMLLKNLESFVKKLYNAGARRLAVIGLPPLGCLPMDVSGNLPPLKNASGDPLRRECREGHNSDAQKYNAKLEARVKKMMVAMPKLKIVYMDMYNTVMEMINKPDQFGFKTTLKACCGSGAVELGPLCNLVSITCHIHSEYVFWDSINPSEATYKALTKNFQDKPLRGFFQ